MSMNVCAQTLVLVDSDLTVSGVNQKLTVATLKYMFYHSPENRAYSFNLYEHEICGEEEYVTSVNDLVCKADTFSYEAKDENIVDTLTEVIKNWHESDFACRNIVVFTDGTEGCEQNHEKEELYYLIDKCDYPIYVVFLNQENNESARKTLSAIATTSGGELIESEFPGDDAESDRQITEKLFLKMDEYARNNWEVYEESSESENESENESEDESEDENVEVTQQAYDEVPAEEYLAESDEESLEVSNLLADSEDIYLRESKTEGFLESPYVFPVAGICIVCALLVAVFGSLFVMKYRRKRDEDYAADDEKTVIFSEPCVEGDLFATRLLTDETYISVKLLDNEGEDITFSLHPGCDVTIGRKEGKCDIAIKGDDALSKCHCLFEVSDGNVYVSDLDSSNGTFVNDIRCEKSHLKDMDILKIGSKSYCVRLEG